MREVIFWNSINWIPETLHYSAFLATSRWNEVKAFICRGRHLELITYHLLQYQNGKKGQIIIPVPAAAAVVLLLLLWLLAMIFLLCQGSYKFQQASSLCPSFSSLRIKAYRREALKITKANWLRDMSLKLNFPENYHLIANL